MKKFLTIMCASLLLVAAIGAQEKRVVQDNATTTVTVSVNVIYDTSPQQVAKAPKPVVQPAAVKAPIAKASVNKPARPQAQPVNAGARKSKPAQLASAQRSPWKVNEYSLQSMYTRYDMNHDKRIDFDEFTIDTCGGDYDLLSAFRNLDMNGDEYLSYEETRAAAYRWHTLKPFSAAVIKELNQHPTITILF